MKPIRVLVLDEVPVFRTILARALALEPDIEIAGVAPSGEVAHEQLRNLRPDVLVLGVERSRPQELRWSWAERVATVVVGQTGLESRPWLEAGASAVLSKPQRDYDLDHLIADLTAAVRKAAGTRPVAPANSGPRGLLSACKAIAIGASTGGTEALRAVLSRLPVSSPAICIVQHMRASDTRSFAQRLDSISALDVREASDGDGLRTGQALVAPGNLHLELAGPPGRYHARLHEGPRVCHNRPSIEVLFESFARIAGRHGLGILLTGMGDDGATALGSMRAAGAHTIAQDQATSVIFGMPRAAIERGSAVEVAPLHEIVERIAAFASGEQRGRAS